MSNPQMKLMKKFVLSSNPYDSLEEAEEKLNNRFINGDKVAKVKLYEVEAIYDIKLKLVRRRRRKYEKNN